MKNFRTSTSAFAATLIWAMFFVCTCRGQELSGKQPDKRAIGERIAVIFQETLKRGETRLEYNGETITARTFIPPSTEHLEEIRLIGDDAIPILSNCLNSSGFEKDLAMRFLGAIGGKGVIEPLSRVALGDASSTFRLVALLWLSQAPWDLAFPIISQSAEGDRSSEVRQQAKEILAQHQKDQ
jgi:hypothetical protein